MDLSDQYHGALLLSGSVHYPVLYIAHDAAAIYSAAVLGFVGSRHAFHAHAPGRKDICGAIKEPSARTSTCRRAKHLFELD